MTKPVITILHCLELGQEMFWIWQLSSPFEWVTSSQQESPAEARKDAEIFLNFINSRYKIEIRGPK